MEEKKVKSKKVLATLVGLTSYSYKDTIYHKDMPVEVDVELARELKITGYFKFSKDEE